MKIEFGQANLGHTIQIVANLGVIAGLVFLGIEVRQNSESLDQANQLNRASILSEALDQFNVWRSGLLADPALLQIWIDRAEPSEKSELEAEQFRLICQNLFFIYATVHQRYLLLGDEELALSGPVATARESLRAPGAQTCWDDTRDLAMTWGYGAFVDSVESR